jgi:hypothetical protein
MVTDFDTECWDSFFEQQHTYWTSLIGGFGLLFYVIGIPLAGFLSLYFRKDQVLTAHVVRGISLLSSRSACSHPKKLDLKMLLLDV